MVGQETVTREMMDVFAGNPHNGPEVDRAGFWTGPTFWLGFLFTLLLSLSDTPDQPDLKLVRQPAY